jgi:hypothetical protein
MYSQTFRKMLTMQMHAQKTEGQKKPLLESFSVASMIAPTIIGAMAIPAFWIAVQNPKAVPTVLDSTT